jgi:2-haloacid dehalogenase
LLSRVVAAHSNDLSHAAKNGLRTSHIARPNEHGPGKAEPTPKVPVDVAASSLEHLARKLGA